ncbi:MAG TPA: DUF1320 domain-containing protein [Candidatus Ozemobacteraceae bacterium]|nr:DUF1320 domain-containing protein [Candidatus Ozemobacteraceae bacterium]
MAYCTSEDIEKHLPEVELIQLTDDAGTGAIDAALVTEAVETGDAIINGYLSTRAVTLPLNPVPKLINAISIDLAIWALYNRRFSQKLPENVTERYENALKLLQQIQSGKLSWGSAEAQPALPAEYRTDARRTDRIFPKTVLDKF